jgi:hypothetical protein
VAVAISRHPTTPKSEDARGGGKRTVIMREVVNGLMYILCRAIPKDLPPKSSVYDYHS